MKFVRSELAIIPWRYVTLACAIVAGACAGLFRAPETGGLLRVGYAEFSPYVTIDEHGGPAGLAVQLVQAAAQRSGIRLEWIAVDNAEEALRKGRIDLYPILTVTAERQRDLYSSVPWWEVSQSLLSLREHPVKDPASAAGRRIAIRDFANRNDVAAAALPGAELIRMRHSEPMIAGLCAHRVDAVLLDARLIYEALLNSQDGCSEHRLVLVPLPQTSSPMATFARTGVRPVAGRLYSAIEQLAIDGSLTTLSNRWFALPQQRFVQERLAERQRLHLGLLFTAAVLLLSAFTLWHCRRTLRMRRTSEEAWLRAREAERRFEIFMAHTPAISYIKNTSNRIVYVNRAFSRFHLIKASDAVGRLDLEVLGPATGATRARDVEVLTSGQPVQYVLPLTGPDGEPHHLLVLKFPLAAEDGEQLLGVTAIDISEQQRAADLVASSEERYRMLFEEAPVAIHEIDRAGIVTRINRAGCALCGFTRDEIVGRHASEFVIPELRPESRAAIREKISGARSLAPFERHYQHRDGRILRVEVHEAAILDSSGGIQGLRSCLIDLTELYQAQQRLDAFAVQLQENNAALAQALDVAREATRLKSQFLANMSHEIRTPMNGVLGMTELLIQSGLNEEQRALAVSVSQSGEHLLALINDILDFSKIESGKLQLESAPFDVAATVDAAVELMAPMAHARGLELTYWIAPGVPAQVLGDAARLRQVLLNLLGNSLKFTSAGEVVVQVSVDAGQDGVRFTVADTGIGIPADVQPNIFAAFTQADSTTTRRFGGTGLGLAIAKSIVELMGGEIGVESAEKAGSTFWFTARLPAARAAAPPPHRQLPGARVLIVDDNWTNRSILQRYGTQWGLRTVAVSSGAQALDAMRAQPFDLAIVDMQMPEMDGAELLRRMAADRTLPPVAVLRMIAIGALPDHDTGAAIRKPVKPEALFECLSRLLQPAASPAHTLAAAPSAAPANASRGRVLIAEDNTVNQRVASLQVKHCGFEADVVGNGEEALAALSRFSYSLVLMDCQMPGMDGYAATRELRRRENGARHLPVIALTANAFAADREACLRAGMDDHLSKPVSLRALAAILDRWSAASA